MNYKIAAVVVTYNRLELLKKCLNSLRNQTHKLDEIIVINNSSGDGTLEWLQEQNNLTVITQENSGSAGGQYTGIKTAYEKDYDWIWCFDDDGYPDPFCLQKLLIAINEIKIDVISPIPINVINLNELAFFTPLISDKKKEKYTWELNEIKKILNRDGIYFGWASFFNGVLISRAAITKVGFPKKELFIWGDEIEYCRRIIKANFKVASLIHAKFYHPKNKWVPKQGLFHRWIYDLELDWRAYYYFRNHAFLSKENYSFYDIKFLIAQIVFFIKGKKNVLRSVKFLLSAYWNGITNNFKPTRI